MGLLLTGCPKQQLPVFQEEAVKVQPQLKPLVGEHEFVGSGDPSVVASGFTGNEWAVVDTSHND